jgi:hypothetical protein
MECFMSVVQRHKKIMDEGTEEGKKEIPLCGILIIGLRLTISHVGGLRDICEGFAQHTQTIYHLIPKRCFNLCFHRFLLEERIKKIRFVEL